MRVSITVVGSLNMDLVIRSPRIPRPGETIIGGDLHIVPGGKGANQAVAAARLGARVSMVGRVGQDAFADPLLESLAADGVDRTFVVRDGGATTGVALIVVDDSGENSIVVSSGANMRLSPADIVAAEAAIAAADLLILQLEVPLESVMRSAELARAHGAQVLLNPAPARPLPARLLSMVDVLVPNESEAALLTGLPADADGEATKAAKALLGSGVEAVILPWGNVARSQPARRGWSSRPPLRFSRWIPRQQAMPLWPAWRSPWRRGRDCARRCGGATPPEDWPPPSWVRSRHCPRARR